MRLVRPARDAALLGRVAVLILAIAPWSAHAQRRPDSLAIAIVRSALEAVGGDSALVRAGGIELHGTGTYDIGVRLQGQRAGVSELMPLEEHLAIAFTAAGAVRLAHESRTHINSDAEEWLRTIVEEGERTLLIDRLANRAFRIGAGSRGGWRRTARVVPQVLLSEAAAAGDRLHYTERRVDGGDALHVITLPVDGRPSLRLLIDDRARLLRGFEYDLTLPVRGRTRVAWALDAYRNVTGLGRVPGGYTIRLGDRMLRRVTYDTVRAGGETSELFITPPNIEVPPPQPPPPTTVAQSDDASTPRPPDVRTLAPGVFLAPNVRAGFHHLFVEFAEFVLVVDATAPWAELHEIPATISGDGDPGHLGERLLEIVRSAVPTKPVRYVALTHHHDDHAGGVKPLIDAGATVLATEATRGVLARIDASPRIEIVRGRRSIADSTMEVVLMDVGENPHADGMLVVWLPKQRLLYTSDLWEPTRTFPNPARVPVMRWFVEWLDRSGLDAEQIFAIHGSARVTPEQLEMIRRLPRAP